MGSPTVAQIRPPAAPGAVFVSAAPQSASAMPTDVALRDDLRAMGTPVAVAILAAFDAFGKRDLFATKLLEALSAVARSVGSGIVPRPIMVHLARLGAEAFVLGVRITGGKFDDIDFADRPSNFQRAHSASQQEQFLHFAVRRLLELPSTTPGTRRLQMDRAIELFIFFQSEIDASFRIAIADEADLVAYRKLMFELIQKHYQALMDNLLATGGAGSGFKAALKQIVDHVKATMATDLRFATPPTLPLFRIDGSQFRDYFDPPARGDFRFFFYSRKAPPLTGQGPEIVFRPVIRKRLEQILLLHDLRPGPHLAGESVWSVERAANADMRPLQRELSPPFPEPPQLHDNLAWQAWARKMWDTAEKPKPTIGVGGVSGKIDDICQFISRYFHAFTVHVPFDLAEGSREANFLTRSYPRAITGCLVHDCAVYAIRWIFMLGRLLTPTSMPRELGNPRISIIEMPSHVGVMIRVRLWVGGDVLIAVNNQDARVAEIEPDVDDATAAQEVVRGMYPGLKVAMALREIKANPTNATALSNELAKLSDRKLKLPYDDASEPFLRNLRFNQQDAVIAKRLADQVGERWRVMIGKLDAMANPGKRAAAIKPELVAYRAAIEPMFVSATRDFDTNVTPIAVEIKKDLDANLQRVPRDATTVETTQQLTGWQKAVLRYRTALDQAEQSLDLSIAAPELFFPDDGFPTDVQ